MVGSNISHNQILDKLGKGRRGRNLSHPRWGSVRQLAIRPVTDVSVPDAEQLAHIKRHAEFWLLKELQRG